MKNSVLIFVLVLSIYSQGFTQQYTSKKPIDFSVYDSWKVIDRPAISDNGKWVSYEVNPYEGDGELIIMNPDKLTNRIFPRGEKAVFSPSSKYIAFNIIPQKDTIRQLKLKKAKKDKFPKDTLAICILKSNKTQYISDLKSFNIPVEKSEWMAYMHEFKETVNDSNSNNKKPVKKNEKKPKDMPAVYDLVVLNPIENVEYRFKDVTEFNFSRNGKLVGFIQVTGDSTIKSKVSVFNTEKQDINKIFENEGVAKKINIDNQGSQAAFLFSADSLKEKIYSLYLWSEGKKHSSEIIIDTNSLDMPKDWVVSEFGNIWFSRDDLKLYFGTALKPEPEPKDTLLDEEKINVDVWSWKDPLLQSQQLLELKKEKTRSYLTVYHINTGITARLADELIYETETILNGNGNIAMGIADSPFRKERSWSYPWFRDIYVIDVSTGNKKIVLERTSSYVGISPFGKFIFWFSDSDSCWHSINTKTFKESCLTKGIPVNFYDEEFDRPTNPPSYDFAGWTEYDSYFLVYDKYDIWKVDPNGIEKAVCITNKYGRKNNITFRYINLNDDITYIDSKKELFLGTFNNLNKKSGYYKISLVQPTGPIQLILDDYSFSPPRKAKNSDKILWQKSSISEFPNLWYSDLKVKDAVKISNANPQQKDYIWANVELVKWTTFDQKVEEGLLYKPENFDPSKKYPMIVRIYEKYSDLLHSHQIPIPSRSSLDIISFVSNGYLVFLPNIRYQPGNPGKSAYNSVVSGTKSLIQKGFVDEKNIGIQGHSWGGYEVAFLVTQTNLFKAASAGAPVSNMTSAYGNIYWKFGISRMSMYESDQSRIGASLWEKPELYFKNSPIFYADKIETPLLIMHNDGDDAVSWYQGIELFVAMRRLNKPVWLLNYNNEPHNLKYKSPNAKDLSMRMFQFFNHYLKDTPAPEWLEKGIPAIMKGKTLGYDLMK